MHIRVCGEGSWTRQVRDYLARLGPNSRNHFKMDRQGANGKLPGKILGPEGVPMFQVDGPHSAPTQHIHEYKTVMVVGAGIGSTPVASTLKAVALHLWRFAIGEVLPSNAHFVWVCGYRDVDAFRWFIRAIKDAQDEICHLRATAPQHMAQKVFSVQIYVTSVPKNAQPPNVVVDDDIGFWGLPREDNRLDKVRADWDEADLYRVMKAPGAHIQMGDVHIYEGRPKWEARFSEINKMHPEGDVGVAFCGSPAICKDLRKMCFLFSRNRPGGIFKLHKENF